MFFPDVEVSVKELARAARLGGRVCAAVWGVPKKSPWTTTITGLINKHVEMPRPPPGSPGLFRCAAPAFMEAAFRKGGLKDVAVKHIDGETAVLDLVRKTSPDGKPRLARSASTISRSK